MLLLAANAGVAGVSRLAFTMGTQKHLPVMLSRVHYRFRTPHISIIVFCTIAIFILLTGINDKEFFEDVGALYVFGALLSFAFVHASILSLRMRKPEMERPFKLRFSVSISGRQFPISAALGLAATLGIWMVIVVAEPYSRELGFLWMAAGLIGYYLYRRRRKLPLT
jgi:APA family basic amino acid/polyamine antiporter